MSPSLNPVGAKRGSVKDMFYVSFLLNFTSLLRRYKKINSTKEEIHILTLNEKKEQILYSSDVFQYGSDGSLSVIMNRLRKKVGSEVMIKTI